MTDFNQLAAPRFAEGVRRLLGEDIQVATVAPELAPYFSLQSDRPEWKALFGETLWHHGGTRAALAANFSSLTITARQNGRISVVTHVMVINAQAGAQTYKLGETNGHVSDTVTNAAVRDQRQARVVTGLGLRAQAGDDLVSLPAFAVPAGQTLLLPIDWPIVNRTAFASFGGLTLQGGVVNQEVTAYFWGYERTLRAEEELIDQ